MTNLISPISQLSRVALNEWVSKFVPFLYQGTASPDIGGGDFLMAMDRRGPCTVHTSGGSVRGYQEVFASNAVLQSR